MGSAASEMNLGALLPSLETFLGWIELILRIVVMAGPLLLLGFGLLYLLAPPKEANYGIGYRFWRGMSSLEAWTYTQRLAGVVWSILGGVLTVVMAIICSFFRSMDTADMAIWALVCVLCELLIAGVACVIINLTVMRKYDKDGYARDEIISERID